MSEIVINFDMDTQSPPKALIRPHWVRRVLSDAHGFSRSWRRDAVDKTLQRLVKWGELRRIDRGLYDKPLFNSLTQQQALPIQGCHRRRCTARPDPRAG